MYKNAFKYDEMKRREHLAVRNTVGWYCFTHHLIQVSGQDAACVLDRMYTGNIQNLKIRKNRYTLMLNPQGRILDDVIIIRQAEDVFWISNLNFFLPFFALQQAAGAGARIEVVPLTGEYAMYSVQGPRALELMDAMTEKPVDDLAFFTMEDNKIGGVDVKVNRAGFTGEKYGYEIYVAPSSESVIVQELREKGKPLGAVQVTDAQLMSWSIPAEKGLLLHRDLVDLTPMDADMERFVCWDKGFTGKDALLAIRDKTPDFEIVGFTLDEDDAFIPSRHYGGVGAHVYCGDEIIGQVAKFVYSFVLEKNIGLLLIEQGRVKQGDHVRIHHNCDYDAIVTGRSFI